ncbi:hypothetical protein LR68_04292 [Anoxybacillus sp. BCO1]|nr:hypothetical protein LR68_04292 [Anoxybacillus sp. BCO1]
MTNEKVDVLSAEEQQKILEKYDPESNTRKLTGVFQKVTFVGLLAFSLFQLYTAIFGVFTAQIQRSIHLGFALASFFFYFLLGAEKERAENFK